MLYLRAGFGHSGFCAISGGQLAERDGGERVARGFEQRVLRAGLSPRGFVGSLELLSISPCSAVSTGGVLTTNAVISSRTCVPVVFISDVHSTNVVVCCFSVKSNAMSSLRTKQDHTTFMYCMECGRFT